MIELNKIYNQNCLDTMSMMPDNFVDLTVTSPPYDNLRKYNGYSFEFEKVAAELYRVTKPGGVVVWVVGDATVNGSESGTSFRQALYFMECGFRLHDTMIYAKNNFMPLNHNRYEQLFEYCFIFSNGTPTAFNPMLIATTQKQFRKPEKVRGAGLDAKSKTAKRALMKPHYTKETKIVGNILYYNVGIGQSSNDDIAFNHAAIFPEKLARDMIYSWSNEGNLIYDPFMGSGTTAKMAHLQKRNWIGSEISEEYVQLANKRIEPYLKQLSLL